jgi:hypothetical protein
MMEYFAFGKGVMTSLSWTPTQSFEWFNQPTQPEQPRYSSKNVRNISSPDLLSVCI